MLLKKAIEMEREIGGHLWNQNQDEAKLQEWIDAMLHTDSELTALRKQADALAEALRWAIDYVEPERQWGVSARLLFDQRYKEARAALDAYREASK